MARLCNARFAEKGLDCRIDNRSYVRQGIEQLPTVHEGPAVRQMEAKGIRTEKRGLNRWIQVTNTLLRDTRKKIAALLTWLREAQAELAAASQQPKEPTVAQLLMESAGKIQLSRKQLDRAEKRISELKRLFVKIYEDNASGRLSEERFEMLSQSYEAEQKQLEAETVTLQQEIEVQERQNENLEKFIQKAHKYVKIETLDPYALRELVSAIYVEAPDKSSGKRRQSIHIKYDGLGFIPLDELMPFTVLHGGVPRNNTARRWQFSSESNSSARAGWLD